MPIAPAHASYDRHRGRPLDTFTPLRDLVGNVTPADLHYVSSHGSVPPDIDPGQHRLVISGPVKRPLVFTMDELVRLPSVSRPHYIECVVNRPTTEGKTVEQMHGMISGLAWSGSGAVRRVEVSADGGHSWSDAAIDDPPRRMAWTRFTAPWAWNGKEAMLQSRCTDEKGQIQPSAAEYAQFWGTSGAPHGNAIQPWRVTDDGFVLNAF